MSNKPEYSIFDPAKIPCEEISDSNALVKEPLVSVKMITYNHAPYIAQAIEGVLQQETSFPFELIIGEDCSTDGTREIVFEYQKKYPDMIRVITSDHNVGATKNSCRTERACRGKYIAYCEGDDYWHHPLKLQKQVDFLEHHPDIGLVFSDYHLHVVSKGKLIKNYRKRRRRDVKIPKDKTKVLIGILRCKNPPLTCTVCAKKDLIDNIKVNDRKLHCSDYFLMGDTQLWAEMSQIAKFYYIEQALATHNVLEESATHSKDRNKRYEFRCNGAEMAIYLAKKYQLPENVYDAFLRYFVRRALMYAICSGDKKYLNSFSKYGSKFSLFSKILFFCHKRTSLRYLAIPIVAFREYVSKLKAETTCLFRRLVYKAHSDYKQRL